MKKIEFYKDLLYIRDDESIKKFLLFNSALVIANIKPSVTVTIQKTSKSCYSNWLKYGENFLSDINLQFINLREDENSIILLIYKTNVLKNYLLKDDSLEFLINLGYKKSDDIEYYVENLKDRYEENQCPHELGIFLGIPLDDVKIFMECKDKKCLGCGYWKVYSNYDEAKRIFRRYDEVKDTAMKSIIQGLSIDRIITNIIVG